MQHILSYVIDIFLLTAGLLILAYRHRFARRLVSDNRSLWDKVMEFAPLMPPSDFEIESGLGHDLPLLVVESMMGARPAIRLGTALLAAVDHSFCDTRRGHSLYIGNAIVPQLMPR